MSLRNTEQLSNLYASMKFRYSNTVYMLRIVLITKEKIYYSIYKAPLKIIYTRMRIKKKKNVAIPQTY